MAVVMWRLEAPTIAGHLDNAAIVAKRAAHVVDKASADELNLHAVNPDE
jgi:hypothetical protein